MRALALAALVACGGPPPAARPLPPPDAIVFDDDPVAVLADLEERLVAATWIDVAVEIQSIGVVDSDLRGTLRVERERVSWIKVRGRLAGTPVRAKWSSLQPVDPHLADTAPPVWAESLLLGLTRMGSLHNCARVIGGADPDTGHGDVRTWIDAVGVEWKGGDPRTRTITYDLLVNGLESAEGELTLDDRGLPLRREVLVHFDAGDMRVVERYPRFEIR